MKPILRFLCCAALFFLGNCQKYKTQFEGPYDPNAAVPTSKIVYPIVFVQAGALKVVDFTLAYAKTFPVGNDIKYAAINTSSSKIAYKSATSNITIIDSTGKFIATVPNTATITNFDWHPNEETLYYLENQNLKFYGPAVTVAVTNLASVFPALTQNKQVFNAVVRADGSVLFMYEYFNNFVGLDRRIKLDKITGTDIDQTISNKFHPSPWMKTSLAGNLVYYGGLETSGRRSYALSIAGGSLDERLSNILLVAASPDGNYYVDVSQTTMTVIDYAKTKVYRRSLDGSTITDLDW